MSTATGSRSGSRSGSRIESGSRKKSGSRNDDAQINVSRTCKCTCLMFMLYNMVHFMNILKMFPDLHRFIDWIENASLK